jgi:hypothetical protein
MASTYSNLGIELIGSGEQTGTWGTTTNTNLGILIDQAISGYALVSCATGTDTTITIPSGATGVARNMFLKLTGTGGASTNLIVPSNITKLYFIFNATTGAVTVKTATTGVSVPAATKAILFCDGTDIISAVNGMSSLTLTGTAATNTQIITAGGTTTGNVSFGMTNTSGGLIVGAESSVGGTLITGAPAYATVLETPTQPLFISTNAGTSACVVVNTNGELVLGNGDAVASPSTGFLRATSGLGTNIAGASLQISAGASTGTGNGGSIILYTSPASTSGSSANAAVGRLVVDSAGNVGVGSVTPTALNGVLQVSGHASVQTLLEKATISAIAATGALNYDALTQAVLYYTSNASANWTLNIRGSSSVTLNSTMQTNQALTIAFAVTQGATAYYQTAITIDGNAITPKWQGSAPTAGNANSLDVYTITIFKTGSAAFTALASQTKFS